jgi:hypothetical protein
MEGEGTQAETPAAQPAAFASYGLERDDGAAGEQAAWGGQPLRGAKAAYKENGSQAKQGATAEEDGQKPSGFVQDGEEARGETAQDADKNSGEQRWIEPVEPAEKLRGNPENCKSDECASMFETQGCSPPAL